LALDVAQVAADAIETPARSCDLRRRSTARERIVSEAALRRVLERVAPSLRASVASGSFVASSYSTPLALAALALEEELRHWGDGHVQ
jgi:hypothetical protein